MFTVRRSPENPILTPRREHPWEAFGTYNPSVVQEGQLTRLYYRALADPAAPISPYAGQSTIGMALSDDGVHFHSRQQVLMPQESWDAFGCEDPRATFFEGKWYLFYTALGGFPFGPGNIKIGVAIGDTPNQFTERHLVTPFNAKAATLFPSRINGEIVMLITAHTDYTPEHPRPTIGFARAKKMEEFWDPQYWERWHERMKENALPELRRSDGEHMEVGAAPILTERGWVLIYSYIQNYYDERRRIFGVEAALLDKDNPQQIIGRTYPFLVPEEIYEEYGIVPGVAFPSSATLNPSTPLVAGGEFIDLWYGAADTTCAKASIRLADLLRALEPERAARTFARAAENPILAPQGAGFESRAAFNAAALDLAGSVHILYRAMDSANTSTIGYARSEDGVHICERHPTPAYSPRADFESKRGSNTGNSGCEDPRAVILGERIYMTYTAYDGAHSPRGAVSSITIGDFLAKNFEKWSPPQLVTPDNVDDKDVSLLPEKVGENYLLYHRISNRICADVIPDLTFGKRVSRCIEIMGPREGMWDAAKVGIAGPPIKVNGGWIMIYHGVSHRSRYRLGAALLDPSGLSVLARTADPIFEAVEPYEIGGEVGNVVFSCGHIVRPSTALGAGGDTVYLYYGGGDKVLGVATTSLSRILAALS